MKLFWTPTAFKDLQHLFDFISQDKPAAAKTLIISIEKLAQQLTEFPNLGRVGRVHGTREMIVAYTPYIIVYRIHRESIQILSILHSSKKYT